MQTDTLLHGSPGWTASGRLVWGFQPPVSNFSYATFSGRYRVSSETRPTDVGARRQPLGGACYIIPESIGPYNSNARNRSRGGNTTHLSEGISIQTQ